MSSAPSPPRQPDPVVLEGLFRALRTYTGAIERYVAAMSHTHDLNRTDLAALAAVMDGTAEARTITARDLATAINLSPSATSSLLDRLERAGHIRRSIHPGDRRRVIIEITSTARETGGRVFDPLGQAVAEVASRYEPHQLQLVIDFLDQVSTATRHALDHTDG
jgi:DNA-binding MarR family transcriptional regulator